MAGTRGAENKCKNCDSIAEILKCMEEKMDGMTARFNGVEELLKEENKKLQDKLDIAEKRYNAVCTKIGVMATQINRLRQDNLSRNLLVKGVPEFERDAEHLKVMMGQLFEKLRFNFPMTYIDCFRIGQAKPNVCRPIVVCLPNVGLKNMILRDKRSIKLTCANFSESATPWGSSDEIIYLDEHLTHENHMLYMYTRKLKKEGCKFVWTRNGRIFVLMDEKSKVIQVETVTQVNGLMKSIKLTGNTLMNSTPDGSETELQQTDDDDKMDTDTDRYAEWIENPPKLRKRKNNSPPTGAKSGQPTKSHKSRK